MHRDRDGCRGGASAVHRSLWRRFTRLHPVATNCSLTTGKNEGGVHAEQSADPVRRAVDSGTVTRNAYFGSASVPETSMVTPRPSARPGVSLVAVSGRFWSIYLAGCGRLIWPFSVYLRQQRTATESWPHKCSRTVPFNVTRTCQIPRPFTNQLRGKARRARHAERPDRKRASPRAMSRTNPRYR
jgi:hypothetical protein